MSKNSYIFVIIDETTDFEQRLVVNFVFDVLRKYVECSKSY